MELDQRTSEFFGIPSTTDSRSLLGVTIGRTDPIAINNALRRRLAQLHVHPNGNSSEADKIREYLKQLATELLKISPETNSPSSQSSAELTPLDQAIIAALISEGGWNKNSRSRLVGIAASYSITVGGLIRILEAFAEAARSGKGPLTLKQRTTHTIDRTWTSVPTKPSAMSVIDSFIADTAKKFTPELNTSNPLMTLKLAVLFGLLTLLAFVLSLQVLLPETKTVSNTPPLIEHIFPTHSPEVVITQQFVTFENYPTFNVNGIEQSMLQYADQGVDQPALLSTIASSLRATLTKGEIPKASIIKDWNTSIDILGYGWPFIDSQTLQLSSEQIVQVLLQAEIYPEFAKRLVNTFEIPILHLGSPGQIARSSWLSGLLAKLSCDRRLNSAVRNLARRLQFSAFATCDSHEATSKSLLLIADSLLERTEFDNRSLEMWEAWFIVVSQFQKHTHTKEHQIHVIKSIIQSELDLQRVSNTRRVLGRVINDTDWKISSIARDEICRLISSNASDAIDISALTSLFNQSHQSTWYIDDYVLHKESVLSERTTVSNRLKNNWPLDTSELISAWDLSIPAAFDAELIRFWKSQVESLIQTNNISLAQFAKLRMLNEAAVSFWKGRPDLATRAIGLAKRFTLDTATHFPPAHYKTDGTFTNLYLAAGKDQFDQIEAIDTLYNSGATDLGVKDANLLATIALSNSRSRLRATATKAIVELFYNGRNIAIAIVQNFKRAKTKEQITTLVAQLTNVILPEQQSPQWSTIARNALVQHSLTVGKPELWELDEVSNEISTSLISEYLILNPEALQLSNEANAYEAIEMVVDSWRRALPPTYLPTQTIDFNPTGVLQKFLLKQIEYYSLLLGEEARWRSSQHPLNNVQIILDQLHQKNSIIEQLNAVEIMIATHWLRLYQELLVEFERRNNQ